MSSPVVASSNNCAPSSVKARAQLRRYLQTILASIDDLASSTKIVNHFIRTITVLQIHPEPGVGRFDCVRPLLLTPCPKLHFNGTVITLDDDVNRSISDVFWIDNIVPRVTFEILRPVPLNAAPHAIKFSSVCKNGTNSTDIFKPSQGCCPS